MNEDAQHQCLASTQVPATLSITTERGPNLYHIDLLRGGTVIQTTADRLCFYIFSYCVKSTPGSLQESASIPQFLFIVFPTSIAVFGAHGDDALATGHSVLSYRVLTELKEEIISQIFFIPQLLQRHQGQWK